MIQGKLKVIILWWTLGEDRLGNEIACLCVLVQVICLNTAEAAMTSIATKLGFKSSSSSSKAELELERVRKENAHLRKKMDELAKRHIKPPDSDKSKLLEVNTVFVLLLFSSNKFLGLELRVSLVYGL